ncbi:lipase family protein [Ottowia sp.]|uniref:lipase family protein n=1 Tax=Ottowia sp. TaxID=1898956 RepID=UPI0025F22106|nr:lipase family protein [Ottowia sp.]MBK6748202.1 esterase [Ottowia sp.]
MKLFRLTCVASAAAVLAACGGSDGPDRGELLDPAAIVTTLTVAQIDAATAQSGLQAVSGPAKCDVKVVALNYATIGAKGEDGANSSGVMLVPAGSDPACSGAAPLVAYARGTNALKTRTLANPQDGETASLIAFFAAQGYAVVATDYLGYAKSTYTYHPYQDAASEGSAVIDSVRAAGNAASAVGAKLSGKVMFTGYSQGGHSSAAAQRAAEDKDKIKDFSVVGGAHLAGPYNLGTALSLPTPTAGSQLFLPFIITAWQHAYGNIYGKASDAFQPPYDGFIETAFPSTDVAGLYAQLRMDLPAASALNLILQPAFVEGVRAKGNNPLYQAGLKNSFIGWTPKAPVLLCGGSGDPVVPPAVHQNVLMADFTARNVTNVTSVDVDAQVQAAFAPGGVAPTDPATPEFATYYSNYHSPYEPMFCYAAARQFFDSVR